MKAVIIKLNHQKAIEELGQAQLDNMYYKIDRIYAGVWNLYDSSDGEMEDLIEGLFHSEL